MKEIPVDRRDLLSAFYGGLPMNLKLLREICHVQSVELRPEPQSPFYSEDGEGVPMPLSLPIDASIGLTALRFDKWDPRKQEFLGLILRDFHQELTLVDVGSNVGLFARQCLNNIRSIRRAYCYEPNAANFRLLRRNLGGFSDVELNPFGLSNKEGRMEFYVDPDNAGNKSLTKNAMPDSFQTVEVDIRHADKECARWIADGGEHFIYKSDTQGYDEIIATALDPRFWPRVKVAIFELWRLPGKSYDRDAFAAILDQFPNKILEKNPSVNLSSVQVLDYLSGDDREYDDLFAWRS